MRLAVSLRHSDPLILQFFLSPFPLPNCGCPLISNPVPVPIARVVEWQTRTFEGRMPKGVGVRVPPRALLQMAW